MICVQNAPCVNLQPDAMAGFDPQDLSRTKAAAARYIVFFYAFALLFLRDA